MKVEVEILASHNIDKLKWDACISKSHHSMIYAYSFYLDHLADNWNGIIINDYEAVMPIPWRKKLGIIYSYDVPFIQQLGWYSPIEKEYSEIFLKALFSFCSYGGYYFNHHNNVIIKDAVACNNYVLPLLAGYKMIAAAYSADMRYNLKKSLNTNLFYKYAEADEAVEMYKTLYAHRMPHITNEGYGQFRKLSVLLTQKNSAQVRKVCNAQNDTLSIALLLQHDKRIYNLMNSTVDEGRKKEANHFLFDAIFREFAGNDIVFDFEGSDIPGIKNFYEKTGAVNQPYKKIHFNRLPFPLRHIKS